MREISPQFAAALASSATTLCRCWRLARRDGAVLGFTDHDRDLAFAGAIFRASTGLDAAQAESAAGLAVGSGDAQGALVDGGVEEEDIEAGLYDGASVEIWLVDWSDVDNRVLIDAAVVGEIRRSEFAFTAELRSLAHRFDEEQGRQFQRNCAADFGDPRCGVDPDSPDSSTQATVVSIVGAGETIVAPEENFAAGFFDDGSLVVAGTKYAIRRHDATPAGDRILLWSAQAPALEAGARVKLRAGCDKSPEACAARFGNIVNFRGFPHMPGNDFVVSWPNAGGAPMDGGSLFR
jgi:uncharacterized phage protein (TIGR02218 family)